MSFHPIEPSLRVAPTKVSAGTYVIHEVQHGWASRCRCTSTRWSSRRPSR